MKYEINFNNNTVDQMFLEIYQNYEWSERNFEDKDLIRNIFCTANFESVIKTLRLFGAETETGTYSDEGYLRIGFARINGHEFVKNSKPNYKELNDALWEIAHPKQ